MLNSLTLYFVFIRIIYRRQNTEVSTYLICNGTGKDPLFQEKYCTVCNGYKIINQLTGLPLVKTSGFHKMIDPQLINLQNLK